MKLQLLEIQAFGPFANKQVIDFSALGENALFLIDGPTGAGKSSILHAICYALYGETTDSDRKELGLRCDHAQADALTELSLTFSIRGNKYRITRIPTQMRPTKRGEGETEQKSTAHLCRILEGGEEETLVAKKKRDADLKIDEIVGLTAEQFLQVMVLPQGKFRELLLAKSDDRQLILSTLFQTEVYKRIEDLLKTKAALIEKQNQTFEERKTDALADVGLADIEMLENSTAEADALLALRGEEKEQANEKQQSAITTLETAKILDKSFATQDSKQKELATYLQQTDEMQAHRASIARAEKAATIAPTRHTLQVILKDIKAQTVDIDTAETDKKAADERIGKAKEAVALAVEDYKQRDTLKAEETTVSAYQAKLESYQLLKNASERADHQHTAAVDKKSALAAQATAVEQTLEKLKAVVDTLAKASANKAETVEQKLIAKGRYEQRHELEAARNELATLNKAYQKEKIKVESAESTYNKAEAAANRTEMLWFSNQAAVLAAKLKENQPCAVCGSLKHPDPALFSEDSSAINQQTVDRARELQAKKLKALTVIKEKCQECLHFVKDKEKDIHGLESELAEDAHKSVAELEKSLKMLEQDLKAIETKEKQWLKAKKQQAEKENERSPIAQEIKAIEDNIAELTVRKATAKSELDSTNNTLPEHYRSTEAIKRALADIQQKIKHLENSHNAANKELTGALNNQSSIKSRLATLTGSLDELKIRQQSQAQLWEQALIESDFATQNDFVSAQLTNEVLENLHKRLKNHDNAVKTLQAELGLLAEQLKDKQSPDLEKLQQQSDELSDAFKFAEDLWTKAAQQQQKLVDTRTKIVQIEAQQAEIKKQYEIVGTLSKAASGRGNVRVSLERFVLGNILDQVLSTASQRLHIMSKGQYRLIRQNEETQKRNTTAGLNLAIDDAHTGKTRPVATLSGGESFMASLALALGLSDIVQERSGGIQLDTLFIDEGFGSLDQDSLQLAINTLIDLQSTGRTIGVISHVSELKEQMAQRIEVSGSRSGSTIKVLA